MDRRFKLLAIQTWLELLDLDASIVLLIINFLKSTLFTLYDTYKRNYLVTSAAASSSSVCHEPNVEIDNDLIDVIMSFVPNASFHS